jgi:hypothetical protein
LFSSKGHVMLCYDICNIIYIVVIIYQFLLIKN